MSLLEVRDLAVHFPVRTGLFRKKRFLRAVDGVDLTIEKGEILGLVGESGCGKSTLGRALVRLETPRRGKILLDGQDLLALRGSALRKVRRHFQMIFQDPYGSLNPRMTIYAALKEVLWIHFRLSGAECRKRVEELLAEVGLPPEALERYPHQFSGGQRQRIGIARALAAEPDLIVADEPISALDVSVQAAIVNLLGQIRKKKGTAFLFIAHDLAVVEHIADRIAVMYLGRIVETGPSETLVHSPAHPYTKALLSAVPTIDGGKKERIVLPGDVPSPLNEAVGCPFFPRCPVAQPCCAEKAPVLKPAGSADHLCACFFAGKEV